MGFWSLVGALCGLALLVAVLAGAGPAPVEAMRTHLASLAAALPRLPQELRRAADLLAQELQSRSAFDVLLLVLGFLGLGAGAEWIFRRATATARGRIVSRPVATANERVPMT